MSDFFYRLSSYFQMCFRVCWQLHHKIYYFTNLLLDIYLFIIFFIFTIHIVAAKIKSLCLILIFILQICWLKCLKFPKVSVQLETFSGSKSVSDFPEIKVLTSLFTHKHHKTSLFPKCVAIFHKCPNIEEISILFYNVPVFPLPDVWNIFHKCPNLKETSDVIICCNKSSFFSIRRLCLLMSLCSVLLF